MASAGPRPETSLLCVSDFGMGSGFLSFAFLGDVRKLSSHLCRMRRRRHSRKDSHRRSLFHPRRVLLAADPEGWFANDSETRPECGHNCNGHAQRADDDPQARDHLGINSGSKVDFEVAEDGRAFRRPVGKRGQAEWPESRPSPGSNLTPASATATRTADCRGSSVKALCGPAAPPIACAADRRVPDARRRRWANSTKSMHSMWNAPLQPSLPLSPATLPTSPSLY